MSRRLISKKVIAKCLDCQKQWEESNAQEVATIHAKKYRHKVLVEIHQYILYDGAKKEKVTSSEEGWLKPLNARLWHYFYDCRSLCGRWYYHKGFHNHPLVLPQRIPQPSITRKTRRKAMRNMH